MFLTGPSAEIALSLITKAIIWLLRRCFSRRTSALCHATPGILYDAGPLASGGVAPKGW